MLASRSPRINGSQSKCVLSCSVDVVLRPASDPALNASTMQAHGDMLVSVTVGISVGVPLVGVIFGVGVCVRVPVGVGVVSGGFVGVGVRGTGVVAVGVGVSGVGVLGWVGVRVGATGVVGIGVGVSGVGSGTGVSLGTTVLVGTGVVGVGSGISVGIEACQLQ